jgi:hypothetical protein
VNPYREGHIILAAPLTHLTIRNNVFYQPQSSVIFLSSSSGDADVVVSDNLATVGALFNATPPASFSISNNHLSTDPKLVNPAAHDFHLKDGSPAIDKGATLSDAPRDHDGCVRPRGNAYDLGAYER